MNEYKPEVVSELVLPPTWRFFLLSAKWKKSQRKVTFLYKNNLVLLLVENIPKICKKSLLTL